MLPVSAHGEGTAGWPGTWDCKPSRVAAFLVAGLFWTLGTLRRSFWEDEFHSLYHAQAENVIGLLERVRSDNHPPLSFVLMKVSRDLFGENPFALRLPSLLAGLGLFWVFLRLSRRLPDAHSRGLAPWLAAGSSYLFWIVTSARMYSWVALAALGFLECVLAMLEEKCSRWWIAPWVALGLHSHYDFFHYLAVLSLAGVALYARVPALRPGLRRCVLPALAGAAFFLPWGAYAFLHQLHTGAPPTHSYRGFFHWLESHAHFLFINAKTGGVFVLRGLALPGVALGALLGFFGAVRLSRAGRTSSALAFAVALLVLAMLGPSWTYLASLVHSRSGFHLKYLASYASPALLVIAAGVAGRLWRRVAGGFLLIAMLAVTIVNVHTPGGQDIHGAVAYILEHTQPGDAVLTRPWWFRDPEHSPTDYGWYARRLAAGREEPLEIPRDRLDEVKDHPRVWLIFTSGYPRRVLDMLGEHFRHLETIRLGSEVTVHLYSDPQG